MAHRQQQHRDSRTVRTTPTVAPHDSRLTESLYTPEDEVALDVDEPPDQVLMFKRLPIRSPALSVITDPFTQTTEKTRQQSLLTRGLSSEVTTTLRPRSVVSSYSNDSIVSTTDLTSDGGLTSPARTTTPSPPLALLTTNIGRIPPPLQKSDTVVFAPEEPPRKRCITFACGQPPSKTAEVVVEKKPDPAPVKKPCTIKFACPAKPIEETKVETKKAVAPVATKPMADPSSTPKKLTPKSSFTRSPTISKNKRHSDALRFHEFASKHLEEDEWVHEKSNRQSKLTISDTLRKENEFRKLGEEVAAEAREAELEEDEAAMDAEDDDEDDNDLDEDLDGEDQDNDSDDSDDLDTDGNESDNEAGFAESDDDEGETNSDYQFWTNGLTTAATSADYHEHIRNRHRSDSASSVESVIPRRAANAEQPSASKIKKQRRRLRMRPATPELPDSTDFVCGTLDEDRPLEAAYIACIAQRKLAKQGILPQDLDPSFPTSDPEQDPSDQEDEKDSADSHDGAWAAGRLDDFEINHNRRTRTTKLNRHEVQSPSISPKRVKPAGPRNRALAHTPPPPRRLFGQSPRRNRSPATASHPESPAASRHPSYEDKRIRIPRLAQRPGSTQTRSLPRTPNPFWKEHRRHRKDLAALSNDDNKPVHSRGPIDIVQGLEDKRRRRKEKFWLTHCRKEAKEKEKDRRRQVPGRGAKRMRELGLEAADRCKGYGQRFQLVLSV